MTEEDQTPEFEEPVKAVKLRPEDDHIRSSPTFAEISAFNRAEAKAKCKADSERLLEEQKIARAKEKAEFAAQRKLQADKQEQGKQAQVKAKQDEATRAKKTAKAAQDHAKSAQAAVEKVSGGTPYESLKEGDSVNVEYCNLDDAAAPFETVTGIVKRALKTKLELDTAGELTTLRVDSIVAVYKD